MDTGWKGYVEARLQNIDAIARVVGRFGRTAHRDDFLKYIDEAKAEQASAFFLEDKAGTALRLQYLEAVLRVCGREKPIRDRDDFLREVKKVVDEVVPAWVPESTLTPSDG